MQVEPVEAEPDASLPLLRRGEVDLAIIYRFGDAGEGADDGLEVTHLLDDEHRAVLPARHRLAARKTRLGEGPRGRGLDRAARRRAGGRLPGRCSSAYAPTRASRRGIALETDDLQAAQAFVAAGLGIALMHDLTMPTRRQSVAVRPIKGPRLARPVAAVTAAGRSSPPAAAMLEVLAGP